MQGAHYTLQDFACQHSPAALSPPSQLTAGIRGTREDMRLDHLETASVDNGPRSSLTISEDDIKTHSDRSFNSGWTNTESLSPADLADLPPPSTWTLRPYPGNRFVCDRDYPQRSWFRDPTTPGHSARLAAALGVPICPPLMRFSQPTPCTNLGPFETLSRELVEPYDFHISTGLREDTSRTISAVADRVLDAPGLINDFYLNILSYSSKDILAVALERTSYIYEPSSGQVSRLFSCAEGTYISALDWSTDGNSLGLASADGVVELWDAESKTRIRSMRGLPGQVSVLAWNKQILSSGCSDGSIWHHDVRIAHHRVQQIHGHSREVCGLRWRQDGELLASGGNDNVVKIWDMRMGAHPSQTLFSRVKLTIRDHTSAIKALAWAPWDRNLLASGGGMCDANIHIWSAMSGARLRTVQTGAQVTSLIWSPHRKEILSTHGYPTNAIRLYAFPTMRILADIDDAHDSRILYSTLSPDGCTVVTGGGDSIKFWRVWDEGCDRVHVLKTEKSNPFTASHVIRLR